MANTSGKLKPKSRRDVAYYKQRQKNLIFTELTAFFAEEAARRGISKKDLAEALSKDPAQITRWLSGPTNFELDTLTEILLALDAELEHRVVRFADKPSPNYVHPIISRIVSGKVPQPKPKGSLQLKTQTASSTPLNALVSSN